jgi:hypothetical protein
MPHQTGEPKPVELWDFVPGGEKRQDRHNQPPYSINFLNNVER